MSKRVIIGTVATLDVGRMYEQMFRNAGIPVTAMVAETGVDLYTPGSAAELWLEDDALLEEAEVRQAIEDILNDPDPNPHIDAGLVMPEVEREQPPGPSWPVGWWLLATIISVTVIPLIGFMFLSFDLFATGVTILVSALLVFIVRSMFVN